MRIALNFQPFNGGLVLPHHYNREVQGMIYNNLDSALAGWLHNEGVALGRRSFKFFTFSRLVGEYRISREVIEFTGPVLIHISSVHEQILQSLAEHLLKEPSIRLGQTLCEVRSIEVEAPSPISRPMRVRTLSPVTTYSTLSMSDGRKKTYYYTPFEQDWEKQLLANLRRKAGALGWSESQVANLQDGKAHIRPLRVDKKDERIMKYRDTVIKAWTGIYELDLPEPFFLLAYDAGLGSKNSQGFGMVEIVK